MGKHSRKPHPPAPAFCEPLENRTLLSVTVEIRNATGGSSATVTSAGQTVNLRVLAVISSDNGQPTQDALQELTGSFIATGYTSASVAGALEVRDTDSFFGNGAAWGAQTDLNNDGNLDIGSLDPYNASQYFVASSIGKTTPPAGMVVGNTLVFQIALMAYEVTSVGQGGQTSINFVPFLPLDSVAAAWTEGGVARDNTNGSVVAGGAFTISDPAIIPPPAVASPSDFGVPINTPTTIYGLTGASSIDPLDPASVSIATPPSHGSGVVQSDGTILYTPDASYLGPDSFQFTVANIDGQMIPTPSTVNLNVNSAAAPTAANLTASTFANNYPVSVDVTASASPAGQITQSFIVTPPAHGIAITQPDGSIQYHANQNYAGSDSFTYRVVDLLSNTSRPAVVNVTVAKPIPPIANDDVASVAVNGSVMLNPLANDTTGSLRIVDEVQTQTSASDGYVALQPDGTLLYQPNPEFVGRDSFTYRITDIIGDLSNIATVTIYVGDVPPTASSFTAAVLAGQTNLIDLLSHVTVTGGAAVAPAQSSVKVLTPPTNGTAVVNADGSISYKPVSGFVGADSFTCAVADEAGGISLPATVKLDVGVEISDARGQIHRLSFTDAAGGLATISLSHGTAGVFFASTGMLAIGKNGNAILTGKGLDISHFALGNTTRSSVLTIRGSVTTPLVLGQISDDSPLGSIVAPSVNVTGDITLNSAAAVTFDNLSNSTITIGGGLPGRFSLAAQTVSDSSLTSFVPISAIKALTWTGTRTISAPAINSMVTQTGGLAANISTAALGVLRVGGSLTGNINAASAKSIAIAGQINGATISITGRGNLGQLTAASVNNSSVSAMKIRSLSLGSITTNNGGTRFGIDANSIGSFTGIFGTTPLRLGRPQLKTAATLAAYLSRRGIDLGDFEIVFGGLFNQT